jgi:tetratricopeptide (TPR) repeat protein
MSLSQAYARVQAGDLAGAEAMLTQIIAADARNIEALNMRVMVRHQRGDLEGALSDLNIIVESRPDDADARVNRGHILFHLKRYDEALRDYERATEMQPDDIEVWMVRAAAERESGRDDLAFESYTTMLRLNPSFPGVLSDRAASLGRLGRYEQALADLDRAIALSPDNVPAHGNRGKVLMELERYGEAALAFERALSGLDVSGSLWNNYGLVLSALGRDAEAETAFDRAAAAPLRDFDAGHPLYNKGLLRLSRSDYAEGFALYARRVELGVVPRPSGAAGIPEWGGTPLDGSLRIWSEQGVGDQILFTRLLPLVLQRAPNVVLDCDPRLAPLLKRAHPDISIVSPAGPFHHAQAQIAMGDLPRVLGVTPNDFAKLPAILRAHEEKTAAIRARYEELAQGKPIIGIAWASPRAKHARLKGASLDHWQPLLAQPYCFVSLQYDPGEDIARAGAPIHIDASVDQMRSLDDFAVQIAALDGIVSISNTTVHVAGALGKPAVVLVPPGRGLHWYWGFNGETTPWYPSLRLVRRALGAPWESQVAEAAALLGDMLAHAD